MAMGPSPSDQRFSARVASAPFIFSGRIVKTGAATVAMLEPTAQVAIVAVDAVFRAPAVLGRLEGQRLTVRLAGAKPARLGDRALFYATSWLYADGIAVVEVGREGVPKDSGKMLARVARAELAIEDDRLAARLGIAELVVVGMVAGIASSDVDQEGPRSEHDPVWWRADLAVERVVKGRWREALVAAFFPSSIDEYWLDVPKPQVRQRGVFLLHRRTEGKRGRFRPPGLTLLDQLDLQPLSHLERVGALVKLTTAKER